MKQHKRLRLVSIVCLAALLVSCLPGAYAYGVSSAWAKEELDAKREAAEKKEKRDFYARKRATERRQNGKSAAKSK